MQKDLGLLIIYIFDTISHLPCIIFCFQPLAEWSNRQWPCHQLPFFLNLLSIFHSSGVPDTHRCFFFFFFFLSESPLKSNGIAKVRIRQYITICGMQNNGPLSTSWSLESMYQVTWKGELRLITLIRWNLYHTSILQNYKINLYYFKLLSLW